LCQNQSEIVAERNQNRREQRELFVGQISGDGGGRGADRRG